MSQIEVPDWVVADVLSRYSALRIERGDGEPWPPELASQQRQEDMHAAITAALGAWVVPAHFATDGAGDVTVFEEFTELDQAYAHAGDDGWVVEAYALRQEKPDVLP